MAKAKYIERCEQAVNSRTQPLKPANLDLLGLEPERFAGIEVVVIPETDETLQPDLKRGASYTRRFDTREQAQTEVEKWRTHGNVRMIIVRSVTIRNLALYLS